MPSVGENINATNARWSFSSKSVVENFESHVSKSVPLYNEGHDLILRLSDFFIHNESSVMEIGCSTGILTHKLAKRTELDNVEFLGLDIEEEMVAYANKSYKHKQCKFICENIVLVSSFVSYIRGKKPCSTIFF